MRETTRCSSYTGDLINKNETPIKIYSTSAKNPFFPLFVEVYHTHSSFDVAMVNVSTTLIQPSFNDSLLANVLIRDTGPLPISSTVSNERHYKVTAEQISRKWGCGLNTARK